MAEIGKILGQSHPSAGVLTTLYTCPAATRVVISTITMCNKGSVDYFRLSIGIAGAADADGQYIYYDLPIQGTDTFACTFGITLGPGDVVRVYSQAGNMDFIAFGVERT